MSWFHVSPWSHTFATHELTWRRVFHIWYKIALSRMRWKGNRKGKGYCFVRYRSQCCGAFSLWFSWKTEDCQSWATFLLPFLSLPWIPPSRHHILALIILNCDMSLFEVDCPFKLQHSLFSSLSWCHVVLPHILEVPQLLSTVLDFSIANDRPHFATQYAPFA